MFPQFDCLAIVRFSPKRAITSLHKTGKALPCHVTITPQFKGLRIARYCRIEQFPCLPSLDCTHNPFLSVDYVNSTFARGRLSTRARLYLKDALMSFTHP